MRQSVRRTLGVGGATVAALGTVLALAIPASAHTHVDSASCTDGKVVLKVSLTRYVGSTNHVTVAQAGVSKALVDTDFGSTFTLPNTKYPLPTFDPTVANDFTVKVVASDSSQYSFTESLHSDACKQAPPTSTTTTTVKAPPTKVTTTTTTTTTAAPVAAVTTTTTPAAAASAPLPNTGVSTAVPLGIAGLLLAAGAAILVTLRLRRRAGNH